MKLHLGCGNDYKTGYINCDISSEVKPDKIVDLEKKLPFKDNSVSEVLVNHVLEHIQNFIPLMQELHRICKKDAKIIIRTPFYSAWGQFNDPTHTRFFTPFTFNYFEKGTYSHEVGANKDMFKVEKVKINFGIGDSSKSNFLFNPLINLNQRIYCRFFAWIFPSAEIYYELKVIK
jgi:SAM-dependent methyltransferase